MLEETWILEGGMPPLGASGFGDGSNYRKSLSRPLKKSKHFESAFFKLPFSAFKLLNTQDDHHKNEISATQNDSNLVFQHPVRHLSAVKCVVSSSVDAEQMFREYSRGCTHQLQMIRHSVGRISICIQSLRGAPQ